MTTPDKTVHGTHKTAHVPSGKHHHRKAAHRAPPTPPDPPKPANAKYQALNHDPVHGADFTYSWSPGACFNSTCTQKHVTITSPADWVGRNIVSVRVPEVPVLTNMRFHRLVAPQFVAFFKAVAAKGLAGHIVSYDGTFVARTLTKRDGVLSNHAFGSAIDISAGCNGYGQPPAKRGTRGSLCELADFCADFGLYWGGWYSGSKDGMHFEAVRVVEAPELKVVCARYGVDPGSLSLPGAATPKAPAAIPVPTPRPAGLGGS